MSKRPCSYDYEAFTRQSKKRITEKEITSASNDMLKSLCGNIKVMWLIFFIISCILEKTVQKLFDGARSLAKGVDGNQNIEKPIQVKCAIWYKCIPIVLTFTFVVDRKLVVHVTPWLFQLVKIVHHTCVMIVGIFVTDVWMCIARIACKLRKPFLYVYTRVNRS